MISISFLNMCYLVFCLLNQNGDTPFLVKQPREDTERCKPIRLQELSLKSFKPHYFMLYRGDRQNVKDGKLDIRYILVWQSPSVPYKKFLDLSVRWEKLGHCISGTTEKASWKLQTMKAIADSAVRIHTADL